MNEPWVYLNGEWLAASKAGLSLIDAGFVLGVTIAEQLRTFHGKIFRLDDHLARLEHSLQLVGIDPHVERGKLAELAREIVARNHRLLDAGDDLGLSIFVTPGQYPAYSSTPGPAHPTVCLHTYPLPFRYWAEKYRTGQSLATTSIRTGAAGMLAGRDQVPQPDALLFGRSASGAKASRLPRLDARSRRLRHRGLDGEFAHLSPRRRFDLAAAEQNPARHQPDGIARYRGRFADSLREPQFHAGGSRRRRRSAFKQHAVLLCLPCTRFNGRPIADGQPGEIFHRLLAAWSEIVGVDIVRQAERFCAR